MASWNYESTTGQDTGSTFIRQGATVVVLLCGGDKASLRRDIEQAKRIAAEWRETNG